MTTSTLTVTTFVLARIAEDEAVARADQTRRDAIPVGAGVAVTDWTILINPTRVLAECAAKRRIVELHASVRGAFFWGEPAADYCSECGDDFHVPYPCDTIRALASVYSDHPDYQQEWSGS